MAGNLEMTDSFQIAEMMTLRKKADSRTDIILVCGGKDFPENKTFLCANSDFFRAMFSSDWKESKSNRIELPTVSAEEMAVILTFLHTGKFESVKNQSLLRSLLAASHFLQVNSLFVCCYKRLFEKLTSHSFLELCNLAFQYNDEGLIEHVVTFLAQGFDAIATSEEFLQLNAEQVQKICRHPAVTNSCMDVVVDGIFRWAALNEGRSETLLQILRTLDSQCSASAFFLENLSKRALVSNNQCVLNLLTAETTSRMVPSQNLENAHALKLLLIGVIKGDPMFRIYDIKQNQWSFPRKLPSHFGNFLPSPVCVAFGGHVYVLLQSDHIFKFYPLTNTLTPCWIPSVPHASSVTMFAAAELNEYIYIVNGKHLCDPPRSTVQRYNPVKGTCEMVAHTTQPYVCPSVLPCYEHLLVFGSGLGKSTVERYDPECDMWTLITRLPWNDNIAAVHQKKLFVVGGAVVTKFQIYDFPSGIWECKQFDGLPKHIVALLSVSIDGKLTLLALDDKSTIYSIDLDSSQCTRKSSTKFTLCHYRTVCVV